MNYLGIGLLQAGLTGLFLAVGSLIGGQTGALMALVRRLRHVGRCFCRPLG